MADRTSRDRLSPAQLTALQLLAHGYSIEQIAVLLTVTPASIHEWLESAMQSLGTPCPEEAVHIAKRRGLIV